jgi:hypothetical protein
VIRKLLIVLAISFLLAARADAATPLNYTSSILEQARAIVAGNQTHR